MNDVSLFRQAIKALAEDKLDKHFRNFLGKTLAVWDYRKKPLGIESLFQIYLSHWLIQKAKVGSRLFITESIKSIIEDNDYYSIQKRIFEANNEYIQPDLLLHDDSSPIIKEMMEIKFIEKLDIIFAMGDIRRLVEIKFGFSEIQTFLLIINTGKVDEDLVKQLESSKDKNKHLFANLLRRKLLSLCKRLVILRKAEISALLFEVNRIDRDTEWIKANLIPDFGQN